MDPSEPRHVTEPGVLSASQLETFGSCERKWAFQYIEGIRAPSTGSAALGSMMHSQLEKYLKGGDLDFTAPGSVGEIAATGLHHLPAPKSPGLEVERAFKFRSEKTGIFYRGFVDVGVDPSVRDGVPLVLDHKSTSSLGWRKTPEVLKTDVQAIIYAKSAFLRWPEAPRVDLRWVYYQTKGARRSEASDVSLTLPEVDAVFDRIELGSQRLIHILQRRPPVLDLPPNPSACGAYGGCPFRSHCNLGPLETLRAMSNAENKTTDLLTRLSGTIPPPAPAPASPGGFLSSLLGASQAKALETAAAEPPLPPWADPAQTPVDPKATPVNRLPPMPVSDQPINPPEFQPAPPSGAAAITSPPAEEKAKRGRKPGTKNKPKEPETFAELAAVTLNQGHTLIVAPSVHPDTIPAPAPLAELIAESEKLGLYNEAPAKGFILFINCMPYSAEGVTDADVLIAEVNQAICEQFAVPEWRLGEPMGFGRGAGFLSLGVAKLAKERGRDIYLDTGTTEGAACKAALSAAASVVIAAVGR